MNKTLLLSLFMTINLSVNATYNVDFLKMSNDGEILELESSEWSCVLEYNKEIYIIVKPIKNIIYIFYATAQLNRYCY